MPFTEQFAQIVRAAGHMRHWNRVSIEREAWAIRGVLEARADFCPLATIALIPVPRRQLRIVTNLRVPGLGRQGALDHLLTLQSRWCWTRAVPDRIADSVTLMTAVPCCPACGVVDNGFLEAALDDHRVALRDRDFWGTIGRQRQG